MKLVHFSSSYLCQFVVNRVLANNYDMLFVFFLYFLSLITDSQGLCRWPLRTPTPLQSILWPIIDPILVTFGQMSFLRFQLWILDFHFEYSCSIIFFVLDKPLPLVILFALCNIYRIFQRFLKIKVLKCNRFRKICMIFLNMINMSPVYFKITFSALHA